MTQLAIPPPRGPPSSVASPGCPVFHTTTSPSWVCFLPCLRVISEIHALPSGPTTGPQCGPSVSHLNILTTGFHASGLPIPLSSTVSVVPPKIQIGLCKSPACHAPRGSHCFQDQVQSSWQGTEACNDLVPAYKSSPISLDKRRGQLCAVSRAHHASFWTSTRLLLPPSSQTCPPPIGLGFHISSARKRPWTPHQVEGAPSLSSNRTKELFCHGASKGVLSPLIYKRHVSRDVLFASQRP